MGLQITVLCENTVGPSLSAVGEHGFAAFIETKNYNYLFDTGQGYSILHNAKCLKKDLTSIKNILLSHGHYDHTGGLLNVLKLKEYLIINAHPHVFSKKYAILKANGKETKRYIGIKCKKEYLEKQGAKFVFNSSFTEVGEGIYLTGEVPRTTGFEKGDLRLLVEDNGSLVPDPLLDDQSLILKTKSGLVIILGCAHSGLINTLQHIESNFKDEKLNTIIGGTHLGFLKEDQLEKTISHLRRYDFKRIGTSHCTGLKAAARLFQEFKDKFFFANVGTSIRIEM
jgi:7,8-dihydropterin-6-yl-methyl-4-(beta-D-ribofuranosyl)aminobenzene 5'-phosphate synthase